MGDLNARLRAKFPPQTPLQAATLATVTVKTPIATGSGFFISSAGHILTNKHVIHLPESKREDLRQTFGDAEHELERHRERLTWRERALDRYRKDLERFEARLRTVSEGAVKADQQAYYRSKQDQYQTLQRELAEDRRKFQEVERQVSAKRRDIDWKLAVSGAASTFTIVLKDGGEFTASLLAVSPDQDLALLKLDAGPTPALRPQNQDAGLGYRERVVADRHQVVVEHGVRSIRTCCPETRPTRRCPRTSPRGRSAHPRRRSFPPRSRC